MKTPGTVSPVPGKISVFLRKAAAQVQDLPLDQADGLQECLVGLAAGVLQAPVLPMGAGQEGTLDIAAHGDHHVHRRDLGQELAMLGGLHVAAVDLLHQPDGVGVDVGLCLRSGGIAFEHIPGQLLAQGLGHQAAAGIVAADKGDFFQFAHLLHIFIVSIAQRLPFDNAERTCYTI